MASPRDVDAWRSYRAALQRMNEAEVTLSKAFMPAAATCLAGYAVKCALNAVSKGDRHDEVWDLLSSRLDGDVQQEISILLPLAPEEQRNSLMDVEFEDPVLSGF